MVPLKHTIVALVQDQPGVLARVVGMFRRRGFNIASLAVGHSEIPDQSRMTFVVEGDDATMEQVVKQLNKLVEVVRVTDLRDQEAVYREMAIIKVRATPQTRSEIVQLVDIYRAGIVDVGPESLIIEVTGTEDKIDSLYEMLKSFGVREIMRTGRVAMTRGFAATRSSETARNRNYGAREEKYESIL
ncbi:MAG: acetolactate synthase small subunit [Dehalococcoidia bacterium]|nr:acetolactate synthase small subunit [Dehalococcoidia bacterium]